MKKSSEATRKHDRILEIYSRLLAGEVINKQSLSEEYNVNPRSIQRDIDSIRDFYSNRATTGAGVAEIKYDRLAKGFRIVSNKTITLTNAELFVVSKILLESRSLSKEEMTKIIDDLLNACLPETERKKMADLISNEVFHYVEPRHGKELVNTIWELGAAIHSHNMIQLEYKKVNGEITHSTIKPVGLMGSEYYFYLIAYIGDKDKKYPGYPTIYRIDRIVAYKITKETFHVPYKSRFEEGEFRKRIPFMYGGKLQKNSFLYTGSDVDAVLDRLPTARAELTENGYRIDVEVYGETGLNMWLNGQGDNVAAIFTNNIALQKEEDTK